MIPKASSLTEAAKFLVETSKAIDMGQHHGTGRDNDQVVACIRNNARTLRRVIDAFLAATDTRADAADTDTVTAASFEFRD